MLAVAAVALRRFLRDRSNLFFVVVLPFLIVFLIGLAIGSAEGSTMGVVGADTPVGSSIVAHLPDDAVDRYDSVDEVVEAVERTEVAAAVIFPDGSMPESEGGDPIRFLARTGTGLDARAELERAVGIENQRIAVARQAALVGAGDDDVAVASAAVEPFAVESERVGDELFVGLDGFDVSALTQVILFTFLSALTASSYLIQDRDLGMARRKASAPVSTARLVVGETLGKFAVAMFQALLIIVMTVVAFGVDWGNLAASGAIVVAFALVATGAGILLGSAVDNAEAAGGFGVMIGLVLAALGGAMAPVEIFPPAMRTVARFTPHYWAIEGLKVSVAGGPIADVVRPLAVLVAVAVGLLAVSMPLYRHRVFGNR